MPQHGFRDLKVGDDTIPHGADGHDVAGRTPQHVLGFGANSFDHTAAAAAVLANSDDGGLIEPEHRSFVDETVRSATNYEYFLIVVLSDGAELKSQGLSASSTAYTFSLMQNHPNPFNPSTWFRFELPAPMTLRLAVFDIQGRCLRTLIEGRRGAGWHAVQWDGRDDRGRALLSGAYFYRLETPRARIARQMLLIK